MKRLVVLLLLCSRAFGQSPRLPAIIPAPNFIRVLPGTFTPTASSGILFETEGDQKMAMLFHDFLKEKWGLDIPVAKNFVKAPDGVISFASAGYTAANPESYTLSVSENGINVRGTGAGLFYGLQTLMQLVPEKDSGSPAIPLAEIRDEPRYKYRGMHLDVGRHMFSIDFIKKYLDILAQYKLNTFHWHLTDDQGWRIEIKKYPELTRVGGYRAQTIVGHYHDRMPQWFDNTLYGGSYSQEEIKDVVSYAAARFITVIPELDMPGHTLAALAAYPNLACNDNPGPFKTAEKWGVFPDVFCPGKDQTFSFVEDVLTEVMALFPSQYIHIGGDECPKTRWKTCRYCQKRMRDNGLKTEEQLQSYFIHRVESFVNSKGRKIIGWDEILQGGVAPNATVMAWQNVAAGINAARLNHDVIMAPQTYLYLDHLQGRADQEPLTIGGYTPLQEVYSFDPTPGSLTAAQQQHIIGVQANVWTEYMTTPQKAEYMIFPRVFALSEIAWTQPGNKDPDHFYRVSVPAHLARLDRTETVYRVPAAYGAKDTSMYGQKFVFNLAPPVTGAKIFYTINGYQPGETEKQYTGPFTVYVPQGERRTVKTMVVTPSGKRSAVTSTQLSNESPYPAKDSLTVKPGLKYYYVPGDYVITPAIDTLKAEERGVTTQLTLDKFKAKARTYGLVFSGYIFIPEDGVYVFSTNSDDGSIVRIDDKSVVENDGKHNIFELTGVANLLKGMHKVEVRYFQAGGSSDLRVTMGLQGRPRSAIPAQQLFN